MKQDLRKHIPDEEAMLALGKALAKVIHQGAIIFLYGPLGAGKTTFTRGFLRGLGYTAKVKSPTYTLVEPYEVAGHSVYHFDLYRLVSANELEQIGISDYFSPSAICMIEWPEKGFPILPTPDLACHLSFDGDGRVMRIEAQTARGLTILNQL